MPNRLLYTGPFNADHHARALDGLCERLDRGARDILYIVAGSAARRRAIADLLVDKAMALDTVMARVRSA